MKIKLPQNETVKEVEKSNKLMESIFEGIDSEELEEQLGIKVIFSSLALPEKEFAFISEQLLNELEKSLNAVDDKLLMVQYLNSSGMKAEDLTIMFEDIVKKIEDTYAGNLSQQKIDFLKRFIGLITNAINDTEGIAKRTVSVAIEKCHPDAVIPKYAKAGDAGMDVYAVEDTVINPGETVIVKTGLKVAIPLGYEIQVRPRSGLSVKTPLRVANSPGTIDSGYRDEIGVIVTNTDPQIKELVLTEDGRVDTKGTLFGQSYTITKGMRFAQLVLSEKPTCLFYEVSNVKEIGFDRASGFGGTGVM